jgi:serine/threonine protein kinase
MHCPSPEQLELLIADKLGPEEYQALEAHVQSCPSCQKRLEELDNASGLPLPLAKEPLLPRGTLVSGKYRIRRRISGGAQGEVYEAWQQDLERKVALKVLLWPPEAAHRERGAFRAEAAAVAGLTHPNIVPVYDYGEHEGRPYFAMEFLLGGTLSAHLHATSPGGTTAPQQASGTPPPPINGEAGAAAHQPVAGEPGAPRWEERKRVVGWVEQLARAVHYAHARKILHRDLKPANTLLAADCTPKVADFGIAWKLGAAHPPEVLTGAGTPPYMAPEQVRAERDRIGRPTDVYSLGAVLYELLTGRPPFQAETHELPREQVCGRKPVLSLGRGHKERDLALVCLKCLHKDPGQRLASAALLAEDLQSILRDEPPQNTRRVSSWEWFWRWCLRNVGLAVASALAVVLLVAAAALSAGWAYHADRQAAEIEKALGESQKARVQTQEQLAERQFDHALLECERGEVGLGLLWMARSLEVAPERAGPLGETLRASMASWHCRHFRLTGCFEGVGDVLAFAPDGRTAWVAEAGGAVGRRELATGKAVGPLLRQDAGIGAVAVGGKGDVVATLAGKVVCLWAVPGGELLQTIRPPVTRRRSPSAAKAGSF